MGASVPPRTPGSAAVVARPRRVAPHPDDAEELRAALAEVERGEGVELTPEELAHWAATGELPCLESPSSRRDS